MPPSICPWWFSGLSMAPISCADIIFLTVISPVSGSTCTSAIWVQNDVKSGASGVWWASPVNDSLPVAARTSAMVTLLPAAISSPFCNETWSSGASSNGEAASTSFCRRSTAAATTALPAERVTLLPPEPALKGMLAVVSRIICTSEVFKVSSSATIWRRTVWEPVPVSQKAMWSSGLPSSERPILAANWPVPCTRSVMAIPIPVLAGLASRTLAALFAASRVSKAFIWDQWRPMGEASPSRMTFFRRNS